MDIPTVNWREFNDSTVLSENILWTVRVAVIRGDDLNLPRAVGVSADNAINFANKVKSELRDNAIIIYYPYFIAEKSGTLQISSSGYIIEAVDKDLWNLVTNNNCDISYANEDGIIEIVGNKDFLVPRELEELSATEKRIRGKFRNFLLEGKTLLLEWSYAVDSDINKQKTGNPYLIFYECRTV